MTEEEIIDRIVRAGIANGDISEQDYKEAVDGGSALLSAIRTAGLVIEEGWKPISEAPTDGTWVLVGVPPLDDLPGFTTMTRYHDYAGWCVDEFREATHYRLLPPPKER